MEQSCVVFLVDWFDAKALKIQKLCLSYFDDNTVQLVDNDTKKNFLKRIYYPAVSLNELFLGTSINIYGRLLHITDYGDLGTKIFIEKNRQRSFLLLQPGSINKIGKVLSLINKANYWISNIKSTNLSSNQLKNNGTDSPDGVVVAIGVVSPLKADHMTLWPSLVKQVRELLEGGTGGGVWAPPASLDGSTYYPYFFQEEGSAPSSAKFEENVTLGLIKPHITKAGLAGELVTAITEAGFNISAIEQLSLDYNTTSEFLDVYTGILPHYREMVEHMSDGPIIAIQLAGPAEVGRKFRELVGPTRVDVAKVLEPESLRGRYGVNEVKNAIHCTDLPEDGCLESRYFFQLLHES